MHRRAALGLLGGAAGGALLGPAHGLAAPAHGLAAPARGLNLSHWFAQSDRGYAPAQLLNFVGDPDFERIAQAGFGHVRVPVDPGVLLAQSGAALSEPVFAAVRTAIDRAARHGLACVIDLHPVGASKAPLLARDGADAFVAGWATLAAALAPMTDRALYLEILNEPEPLKGTAWWALQGRALAAIRAAGWRGPVIANGGGWSGVEDLAAHAAYDDPNVVYTVHCYAPLLFTHQATTWSWDVATRVRGLGWPLAAADADAAAAASTQDDEAKRFVKAEIAAGNFTRAAMTGQFDRLAEWQAAQGGRAIYVGEFGVYDKASPAEARLAWLRAVREISDARGWGWAVWDYSPGFGLLPDTGARTMEADMLQALGMRAS